MRGAIGAKALMDGVIVAVVHEEFMRMGVEYVRGFMGDKLVLVDVRGMFDGKEANDVRTYYKTL